MAKAAEEEATLGIPRKGILKKKCGRQASGPAEER